MTDHVPQRTGPSQRFAQQGVRTEVPTGLDGMGFSVIGINGKEFYVSHRGQRKTIMSLDNPDETAQHLDVIILQVAKGKSHTYYEKGYMPGSTEGPTCVSTDGIAPDDSSEEKQSTLCNLCKHHEWKMQPHGREGFACQDSLRLAVFPMPAAIKATIGVNITEPCLLRIPAASIKGFAHFLELMEARNGADSPFCSYITRFSFKKDVKHPQFEYRLQDWLTDEQADGVIEMRKTPTAWRILGLSPEGRSLTRRENAQLAEPQEQPVFDKSATAQRLADERQARIAAVRAPEAKVIEGEVVVEAQVPIDEPKPASKQAVANAPTDLDALVAAMRPQPPQG